MDKLSELSHGAKVVLGGVIAFLIISIFKWFEVAQTDLGVYSGWSGIGVIAGLVAVALLVWQILPLANVKVDVGVSRSMITGGLAVLLLIFTLIRVLSTPALTDRTLWAWLGLLLAVVIVVGAWMNMQAAGESLTDVRDKVQSMTGGGAAAAPAAEAAAPAPPAAPEPQAAPAEPAAETAEETTTEGDDDASSA